MALGQTRDAPRHRRGLSSRRPIQRRRSQRALGSVLPDQWHRRGARGRKILPRGGGREIENPLRWPAFDQLVWPGDREFFGKARSEEHTSELQSRGHLVCRLLLEKKNGKC